MEKMTQTSDASDAEVTPKKAKKCTNKAKKVTPPFIGEDVRNPKMQQGFRHTYFSMDHEALLYTTIDIDELVDKLDSLAWSYEGEAMPRFALGEVDDGYGMCPHCHKYRWGCREQKFGEYCVKAVKRLTGERYTRHLTVKEAYVVFINYFNRCLDKDLFDEKNNDEAYTDEVELPTTFHQHPPKCMEEGSLLHVLKWADWKERRRRKRRAALKRPSTNFEWIETKDVKKKK